MLRIPAVLLYHDIRRGEEGVDQRHVGSHHQNTGCQASSPLHSNNERNPIVWVCWIYHNLSLCQSQETKESFVHFVMKRAGDSELCITPEARGRHVADTCPAQYILFIQYWWPDLSAAWIWENVVNLNKIKILLGPLRMCCTAAMMWYCSFMQLQSCMQWHCISLVILCHIARLLR